MAEPAIFNRDVAKLREARHGNKATEVDVVVLIRKQESEARRELFGYTADITRWSWRKLCRKTPLVCTLCQCDNNFLCIMALYSAHAESFGV